MKKLLTISFGILLIQFFWSHGLLASDNSYSVELLSQTANQLKIKFRLHDYQVQTRSFQGREFSEVILDGSTNLDQKSKPALPKINFDIAFPKATESIYIRSIDENLRRISSKPILPSRGPLSRSDFIEGIPFEMGSIYESQEQFPRKSFEHSKLNTLRDIKTANIQVHPFRYDFSKAELLILDELTLEIAFTGAQENLQFESSGWRFDSEFLKLYERQFINFPKISETEAASNIIDSGRMLIISHSSFDGELSEFVRWKRQRGLKVYELYLGDKELNWQWIDATIREFYANDKISYVLLVGDADLMPFRPGKSGNAYKNEADPMYALVDGTDSYPDIFVSRIPVNTKSELRTVLRKSIDYEKHPQNSDWYSRALAIASEEGASSGMKDYERLDILNDLLLGWHYQWVDTVYEPNDEKQMITRALNEGRGFINYVGHGWEKGWVTASFQNSDVLELENHAHWPFIVSVACVNGRFAYKYGDSFAEVWLKAGNEFSPKGAVSIFASSTNQSWVPPTVGQAKITELLTNEVETSLGGLFFNGSVAVLEDASSTAEQTFETWHIFGDASIQVRTKAATQTKTKVQKLHQLSRNEWLLHLQTDLPGGSIYLSDGNRSLARGALNSSGAAYLKFTSSELSVGDEAHLSLTGFNRFPYEAKLRAERMPR